MIASIIKYKVNISGKIYSIKSITNNIVSVVLVKTRKKQTYYVSVLFYYQFSELILDSYRRDDFVKIWFRVRSNRRELPNNEEKFFTDIIGEKILLVRRDGVKLENVYSETTGMSIKDMYVIKDTGELIEKHTLKKAIERSKKTN